MQPFENHPFSIKLPDQFIRNIERWYGEYGKEWLEHLPEYIEECSQKWNLEIGNSVENLTANFITNATMEDGKKVILKISPERGVNMEMEALRIFSPFPGIVNLIHFSNHPSAMVLEKVSPGKSLKATQSIDDLKAMEIAAPIIRDIVASVPINCALTLVSDEMSVIRKVADKELDADTYYLFQKAKILLDELESSTTELKVIHGDLHHDNILFDEHKGWLAIDPKGRIGDPVYNAARIMTNYWETTPTESIINDRIHILSKHLNCDPGKVAAWAFLDCMLSEAWDIDELGERNRNNTLIALMENAVNSLYSK